MTDRIVPGLPTGWRGILHDLAVSFGLTEPTQGELEAWRQEAEPEAEAGL